MCSHGCVLSTAAEDDSRVVMSECVSVGLRGGGAYFHCSVETIILINAQFKSKTRGTAADGLLFGAAVRYLAMILRWDCLS